MKVGFIGCGNMGGALARAAAGRGTLLLADPDAAKAQALAAEIGAALSTNEQIASDCDMVVLGVKPQVLAQVWAPLKEVLAARSAPPVIVSMAAGVSVARLREAGCGALPLIRIMPNTPVRVGKGLVLYTASDASEEAVAAFCTVFEKAGALIPLQEQLIDAGSALSGCGPAFVYQFIEALADSGVACGLPRALAQELAAGTVLGSAQMVLETGAHPAVLKDAVCSPGGSTIQGVAALERGAFRGTVVDAVQAAFEKTKQL